MIAAALAGAIYGSAFTSALWLVLTHASGPSHPWALLYLPVVLLGVGLVAAFVIVLVLAAEKE